MPDLADAVAAIPQPRPKPGRSTLPRHAARLRYVEIGEVVALEQIKTDSEALDAGTVAIGPFARLDANAVAARDGKTRGVITNLFGSQAAFQAETMALALERDRPDRADRVPATGGLSDRGRMGRRLVRR